MKRLNKFFESIVEIPRIKVGNKQAISTLIAEEILCFGMFLNLTRGNIHYQGSPCINYGLVATIIG